MAWIAIAGAVFSAISSIQQGQAAKAQGEYNAAVAQRNAGIARDQAGRDAEAQQRHSYRVLGAARAAYGASWITSEGSPMDVLESSAMEAELDRQNILYKGNLRAMGYEETAALDVSRGTSAERQSYAQAGSSLLMGAGKAYGYEQAKKTAQRGQRGYQIGDYDYR